MKKLLALLVLACVAVLAQAKDYGVQANVWPITEIDIRRLLLESAARVDWAKVNQEALDSGKQYLTNLPKRQLPTIDRSAVTYIDPSIVLTSDIQAPVKQADGSFQWQVLYPKGTKVNPLDTARPHTAFLMFDGSKPEQVELAKAVLARGNDRVVPVEAGSGDLGKLADAFPQEVFHADDAMIARFQVNYLPSLVFPGTGSNSRSIGVAAFSAPFKADEVLQSWSVLTPTSVPTQAGAAK
jgi:conjugal transfer pilus assembly protein TraW